MKTITGNTIVYTITVVVSLSFAFASGYIIAAAKNAHQPVSLDLPACSKWSVTQPTPHKPDDPMKCRVDMSASQAMRERLYRRDL
jgi:hypothetical protein